MNYILTCCSDTGVRNQHNIFPAQESMSKTVNITRLSQCNDTIENIQQIGRMPAQRYPIR